MLRVPKSPIVRELIAVEGRSLVDCRLPDEVLYAVDNVRHRCELLIEATPRHRPVAVGRPPVQVVLQQRLHGRVIVREVGRGVGKIALQKQVPMFERRVTDQQRHVAFRQPGPDPRERIRPNDPQVRLRPIAVVGRQEAVVEQGEEIDVKRALDRHQPGERAGLQLLAVSGVQQAQVLAPAPVRVEIVRPGLRHAAAHDDRIVEQALGGGRVEMVRHRGRPGAPAAQRNPGRIAAELDGIASRPPERLELIEQAEIRVNAEVRKREEAERGQPIVERYHDDALQEERLGLLRLVIILSLCKPHR